MTRQEISTHPQELSNWNQAGKSRTGGQEQKVEGIARTQPWLATENQPSGAGGLHAKNNLTESLWRAAVFILSQSDWWQVSGVTLMRRCGWRSEWKAGGVFWVYYTRQAERQNSDIISSNILQYEKYMYFKKFCYLLYFKSILWAWNEDANIHFVVQYPQAFSTWRWRSGSQFWKCVFSAVPNTKTYTVHRPCSISRLDKRRFFLSYINPYPCCTSELHKLKPIMLCHFRTQKIDFLVFFCMWLFFRRSKSLKSKFASLLSQQFFISLPVGGGGGEGACLMATIWCA